MASKTATLTINLRLDARTLRACIRGLAAGLDLAEMVPGDSAKKKRKRRTLLSSIDVLQTAVASMAENARRRKA